MHHLCTIHSVSCSSVLVSGPPLNRPVLKVDLYGGQPLVMWLFPLTRVAVGLSTLLHGCPVAPEPNVSNRPIFSFMTSPWSHTCDTLGRLKASQSCFQDGVIQAFVDLSSVMAQLLSYAALLCDRRDLSLMGLASLIVVSRRLCMLSFVALLAKVRVVGFRRRPAMAIRARTGRRNTGVGLRHRDIFRRAPLTKLTIGVGTNLLDACASAPNSGALLSSRED